MQNPIIPVVLSGGFGSRLWPSSQPERPKQLLSLVAAESMLQLTVQRVHEQGRFRAPWVITNPGCVDQVEAQLKAMRADAEVTIVEPCARNTAAAIALALIRADPEELLLVMPSDHVITDVPAFLAAIESAEEAARQGWLITFGIRPTHPETGYGYIRISAGLLPGVFRTGAFVEKPSSDLAQRYLDEECYLWNAGIFLVQAGSLKAEMAEHAPDILRAAQAAMAKGTAVGSRFYPEHEAFASSPSVAIDRAVMERSNRVAAVPVSMGWSDVGSWDALYAVGSADGDGNVISGNAHAIDAKGCLIRSEGPMVVASGVEDLIIVATADEVLILPRGKSQLAQGAAEAAKARRG